MRRFFLESAVAKTFRVRGALAIVARKFAFRQGLWIEDLRIPPGQECSNGSLILLAVVLWRTFLARRDLERVLDRDSKEAHSMSISYENSLK